MFKASIILLILLPWLSLGQQSSINKDDKSEAALEKNIQNIQKKLKLLKNELNRAYGQEQVLLENLEVQDKSIGEIAEKISLSNLELKAIERRIEGINLNIKTSTNSIEQQQSQIVKLLKLQIYLNHDKTLKMLLINPENSSANQTKHQVKYLQDRLYNLIKEVALEIKELEKLNITQLALQDEVSLKKQGLLLQKEKLDEQRNIRLKTLSELKIEIAKHETQNDSLNKDQRRLQQLLSEIQVLLSDLPKDLGSNKPFVQLKGKLSKPTNGNYIRSFHSRRSENTRWDGVVIKADLGAKVTAIAYGRVAFADWLRGFGMLVILDHQDGYMSLYGFNESINVEVGDWVDSSQDIATIGNSGTLATPAVYFEIRKDAKPLNPKAWIK